MVPALVAFAQVAGSELRSCSARGAALHMSHAAAGSSGRCGAESEQTWRGSYVWYLKAQTLEILWGYYRDIIDISYGSKYFKKNKTNVGEIMGMSDEDIF